MEFTPEMRRIVEHILKHSSRLNEVEAIRALLAYADELKEQNENLQKLQSRKARD